VVEGQGRRDLPGDPDFGGFTSRPTAKASRAAGLQADHADGANLLADAVKPHGGIVMWRAFVYDATVDPDRSSAPTRSSCRSTGLPRQRVRADQERAARLHAARAVPPTVRGDAEDADMVELQITQEYLGWSNHLVYLAPMWKEFFDSDTFVSGPGSTVAKVVDGTLQHQARTGIAGVANTGNDRNWTGHHFAAANWYASDGWRGTPRSRRTASPTSGSALRGAASRRP
jgi:alpha-glucuronidase